MEQLVARRAHNPKVVSSSLAPATQNVIRSKFYVVRKTEKNRLLPCRMFNSNGPFV
jgi:hypothetical protein